MSRRTFTLPPHFLTAVGLHDRGWFETGGFLLARRESPSRVVVATGPGYESERARASIALARKGVDEAAAAAGFVLTGCWHSHPPGVHGTEASPEDRAAWRGELAKSPGLDAWYGVIVLRAGGRTEAVDAWATRRSGACEPVPLPPITEQARTLARSLSFSMARGPLAEPPSKWEPAALQRELARLDLELDLEERVRLNDLNARLKRLGIRGNLTPLRAEPAHRSSAAVATSDRPAAGEIIYGGGTIRRPGIGHVTGIR